MGSGFTAEPRPITLAHINMFPSKPKTYLEPITLNPGNTLFVSPFMGTIPNFVPRKTPYVPHTLVRMLKRPYTVCNRLKNHGFRGFWNFKHQPPPASGESWASARALAKTMAPGAHKVEARKVPGKSRLTGAILFHGGLKNGSHEGCYER